MGFDPEKDALRKAATRQKIVETGFHVFAEKTIDNSNLTDVAEAAGVGMATVYRNFNTKQSLVLEIGTWMWDKYSKERKQASENDSLTAAEEYEQWLEAFLNMYRNHRDFLRFNQFFNIFVQRENIPMEQMQPYNNVIDALEKQFQAIYQKAQRDGTMRTDIPESELFSTTVHLMMAAVTRYAVGLVYEGSNDPEKELRLLKDMLFRNFCPNAH